MRPISILPTLSKLIEHILKDQIVSSIYKIVSLYQYACHFGHIYNTACFLLNLTGTIRNNVNESFLTFLMYLDLRKAFNSTTCCVLIRKFDRLFKPSKSAYKLINSYLTRVSQFVDINSTYSGICRLFSGVPQTSALHPLLFIIYVNDLNSLKPLFVGHTYLRMTFVFYSDSNINCSLGLFLK